MSRTEITVPEGTQSVVITREFDAPRDLVFRAYTDPKLIEQWWGPRRYATVVDRLEPHDGGRWRFLNRDAEGHEFGFRGVFHGTPSPEGICQTWEFEGTPGHVSLETSTLEERNGKTFLRNVAVFQSVEDRDAIVAEGMSEGAEESMDRLAELLARLAPVR